MTPIEQVIEGSGQFGCDSNAGSLLIVANDKDPVEEGLIEHSADVFWCVGVGGVAVRGEVEGHLEIPFDGFPRRTGCVQLAADVGQRFADAILFLTE